MHDIFFWTGILSIECALLLLHVPTTCFCMTLLACMCGFLKKNKQTKKKKTTSTDKKVLLVTNNTSMRQNTLTFFLKESSTFPALKSSLTSSLGPQVLSIDKGMLSAEELMKVCFMLSLFGLPQSLLSRVM